MAYLKNNPISAEDFRSLAGVTHQPAASEIDAAGKAGYLWGIGYGDRGYGETTPLLSTDAKSGEPIKPTDVSWANLFDVMTKLGEWTGQGATLPTLSDIASNKSIFHSPEFLSSTQVLDSNRTTRNIANMTTTTSVVSTTRNTTWGAGNSGISCEFSITFQSEDAARFFFNSGGEIRIALAHSNVSTARNRSWNTVLNGFIASFAANSSSRSGSYGTAQAIGYYQLTTAYQVIVNGANTGVSPYAVNDFYVEAKASTIPGVNGAKGSVLHFRVRLVDEQTNSWSDIVANGTIASLSHLRATSFLTPKPAPTCAVMTAF